MIKIQNTKGEALTLGKRKLTLLPSVACLTSQWVLLKELDVALMCSDGVAGYCSTCADRGLTTASCMCFTVLPKKRMIGCCTFNNKTWKAIVKAAKAARPKRVSQ